MFGGATCFFVVLYVLRCGEHFSPQHQKRKRETGWRADERGGRDAFPSTRFRQAGRKQTQLFQASAHNYAPTRERARMCGRATHFFVVARSRVAANGTCLNNKKNKQGLGRRGAPMKEMAETHFRPGISGLRRGGGAILRNEHLRTSQRAQTRTQPQNKHHHRQSRGGATCFFVVAHMCRCGGCSPQQQQE